MLLLLELQYSTPVTMEFETAMGDPSSSVGFGLPKPTLSMMRLPNGSESYNMKLPMGTMMQTETTDDTNAFQRVSTDMTVNTKKRNDKRVYTSTSKNSAPFHNGDICFLSPDKPGRMGISGGEHQRHVPKGWLYRLPYETRNNVTQVYPDCNSTKDEQNIYDFPSRLTELNYVGVIRNEAPLISDNPQRTNFSISKCADIHNYWSQFHRLTIHTGLFLFQLETFDETGASVGCVVIPWTTSGVSNIPDYIAAFYRDNRNDEEEHDVVTNAHYWCTSNAAHLPIWCAWNRANIRTHYMRVGTLLLDASGDQEEELLFVSLSPSPDWVTL